MEINPLLMNPYRTCAQVNALLMTFGNTYSDDPKILPNERPSSPGINLALAFKCKDSHQPIMPKIS